MDLLAGLFFGLALGWFAWQREYKLRKEMEDVADRQEKDLRFHRMINRSNRDGT